MREGLFYDIMVDVDEMPIEWNKELYDKLSFEYLIECAKNHKIQEWNQMYEAYLKSEWERLFPNIEYNMEKNGRILYNDSVFVRPNYQQKDFINEILDGANLSGVYLNGADFSQARFDGVSFSGAHLDGADFSQTHLDRVSFSGAYLHEVDFSYALLKRVNFLNAHLDGADFSQTYLDNVSFRNGHLEETDFFDALLAKANFSNASLAKANFSDAKLEGVFFSGSHLEGAYFRNAHLNKANLSMTHLEGADFTLADLTGAIINSAKVNEETQFIKNTIDNRTDFTGTFLSSANIDQTLKTIFEKNIRRLRWEKWYGEARFYRALAKNIRKLSSKFSDNKYPEEKDWEKKHCWVDSVINAFVKTFWWISDYGTSTKRIIAVFFGWNILWAFVYFYVLPLFPCTTTTVLNVSNTGAAILQTNLMMFSITDTATEVLDLFSMFCVTIHIVIGYFILAALITRIGILFET